jgi:arsenate reductase
MGQPIRVLFLCVNNAGRSQLAEALLRSIGGDDFAVFSAGTEPTTIHPAALAQLEEDGLPTQGLRAKSVHDFAGQTFDVVISICDPEAETVPTLPGHAERIVWTFPDPAREGTTAAEWRISFGRTLIELKRRMPLFMEAQRTKRMREEGDTPEASNATER